MQFGFFRLLNISTEFILLLMLCAVIPGTGTAGAFSEKTVSLHGKRTLVIGKVTENPNKHFKRLKPMVDYVVGRMKDLGIFEGKVLMARNNNQMISYLRQGKVDWVTETPFSAVLFQDKAGAEILLRKWKKGVPEYHTIFFTRKDRGIDSLADIQGKTVAFEDTGSTTAYFIPAWTLLKKGYLLVRLSSIREKPAPGMVGYVFSNQEVNTSTWVYRGLVDVGALNNLDWDKDDHVRRLHREEMKIIHRSSPMPRAIELVGKHLGRGVKQRLKEVLLESHEDPNAYKALKAYQQTKKFDELDERGWATLEEMRDILQTVKSALE